MKTLEHIVGKLRFFFADKRAFFKGSYYDEKDFVGYDRGIKNGHSIHIEYSRDGCRYHIYAERVITGKYLIKHIQKRENLEVFETELRT